MQLFSLKQEDCNSDYLSENNLLTESQSGFRQVFSTETALREEANEWIKNVDNSVKWCNSCRSKESFRQHEFAETRGL